MTTNEDYLYLIQEKIEAGARLSPADGLALYEGADLWRLGALAERITLKRAGKNVYYSANRHINYTNICRMHCGFCHFSRRAGEKHAYAMTPDEVLAAVGQAHEHGASEVHIVGGINDDLPFDYYLEIVERTHLKWPDMHIKAFTAVEIISMARGSGKTVEQVLSLLIAAGLGSLPGGGAEILDDEYFRHVCPAKPRPDEWLAVHAAAHRLGLMSTCTMLYGHVETLEQRIGHLLKLRELQDESLAAGGGHFQCFIPLPYTAYDAEGQAAAPNALDDLRTIAVSRLMLDNIEHVKAFWPMLSVNLAQVGLCFGADDLDGTVHQYQIVSQGDQGDSTGLSLDCLIRLITEADRTPVRRESGRYP